MAKKNRQVGSTARTSITELPEEKPIVESDPIVEETVDLAERVEPEHFDLQEVVADAVSSPDTPVVEVIEVSSPVAVTIESEDARLARPVAYAKRVEGMTNEEIAKMHQDDAIGISG